MGYEAKSMDDYNEMCDDLKRCAGKDPEKARALKLAIERFENEKRDEGDLEAISEVLDESIKASS